MGQQAHAQAHDDHGHHHEGDQAVERSENGCADAGAAIAIITVLLLTALFWLTGHPS